VSITFGNACPARLNEKVWPFIRPAVSAGWPSQRGPAGLGTSPCADACLPLPTRHPCRGLLLGLPQPGQPCLRNTAVLA